MLTVIIQTLNHKRFSVVVSSPTQLHILLPIIEASPLVKAYKIMDEEVTVMNLYHHFGLGAEHFTKFIKEGTFDWSETQVAKS
jgi:hypothetical protein